MLVSEKHSGETYAVKRISKSKAVRNHQCEQVERELSIHQNLSHQSILRLFAWFHDPRSIYLVTERAATTAAQLLDVRYPGGLCEKQVLSIGKQMGRALTYLHSLNILHRDVKPGNMFLIKDRGSKYVVKLGDFGCSVHTMPDDVRQSIRGSSPYMAPEIVAAAGHSFPVDVWALGISMHELFVNRLPFDGDSPIEIYRKVLKEDYRLPSVKPVSSVFSKLISSCLEKDFSRRPKAADLDSLINS